jgi:hypothetical protein
MRKPVGIRNPVSQAGVISGTGVLVTEPPVIEYEQLDAQFCRFRSQLVDGGLVIVKAKAFPAVEQDWTVRYSKLALYQVVPVETMQQPRHATNTIR